MINVEAIAKEIVETGADLDYKWESLVNGPAGEVVLVAFKPLKDLNEEIVSKRFEIPISVMQELLATLKQSPTVVSAELINTLYISNRNLTRRDLFQKFSDKIAKIASNEELFVTEITDVNRMSRVYTAHDKDNRLVAKFEDHWL